MSLNYIDTEVEIHGINNKKLNRFHNIYTFKMGLHTQ